MRILFVPHLIFLLLAAVLIFASFGGFLGGSTMIASAIVVIVLWGVYGALTVKAMMLAYNEDNDAAAWASKLFLTVWILSALTGLGLAFLAFVGCGPHYLPILYHWSGMAGTVLGLAAWFLLPVLVRASVGESNEYAALPSWQAVVFVPLAAVLVWGLAWLIPFLILKDHVNLADYSERIGTSSSQLGKSGSGATRSPNTDPSPTTQLLLPFPGGESSWVIQGNNTGLDHNDSTFGQKFSWDFVRRCGTPVLASRRGTIAQATDNFDGFGIGVNFTNQVVVKQIDGTFAFYLHIQQGSIPAKFRTLGAPVNLGDEIAKVGCVGRSLTGHIHFMVRPSLTANSSLGVIFTDVSDDNGIPRTFKTYTSGNAKVQ